MECRQLTAPMQGSTAQGEKKKGISGSTIKIIAVVAMLIDHVAAALLTRVLIQRGLMEISLSGDLNEQMMWVMENAKLYYGVMAMRMIGRLGFPIFCFLLVEGFQKTRNVGKYAMRLGIFALISEIPFDLAISGNVLEFEYQNVYFTLLVGILTLCVIDWISKHEPAPAMRWIFTVTGILAPIGYLFFALGGKLSAGFYILGGIVFVATMGVLAYYLVKKGMPEAQKLCLYITVTVAGMIAADLLRTDYSGMGVLTIVMMYAFRRRKVISMLMGCMVLVIMSLSEITALFTLIPVALYNGKRGLKMKYFFYAFYPVHLLLIWLAALMMGMGWMSAI